MDFLNNCYVIYDSVNRITAPYGMSSIYGSTFHNGVDLGWRNDESQNIVYSNGYGIVVDIVNNLPDNVYDGVNSWGNYVLIDHLNGMKTRYAHLKQNSVIVTIGQRVYASTPIGIIGNSGYSTARHLHFEVYKNGIRINPTPYLTLSIDNREPEKVEEKKKKDFPFYIYNKKNNSIRSGRIAKR